MICTLHQEVRLTYRRNLNSQRRRRRVYMVRYAVGKMVYTDNFQSSFYTNTNLDNLFNVIDLWLASISKVIKIMQSKYNITRFAGKKSLWHMCVKF